MQAGLWTAQPPALPDRNFERAKFFFCTNIISGMISILDCRTDTCQAVLLDCLGNRMHGEWKLC